MVKGNRKIGLGVMGFADLLFQLGIPYNSEEALAMAEAVMRFIQENLPGSLQGAGPGAGGVQEFRQEHLPGPTTGPPFRNATTTTIAPTGTLSIIADCSSGIEPLFALSFVRNVMDNDKLMEVNPYFESVAREKGFYSTEIDGRDRPKRQHPGH